MTNAVTLRPEIVVRDVPLDDDLSTLFETAANSEFQQMVMLLQLNRRLARLETLVPDEPE